MLTPANITFATVFGGLGFGALLIVIHGLWAKKWPKGMDAVAGVIANCMTLCTISAFLYNTAYAVVLNSFPPDASAEAADIVVYAVTTNSLGIVGNEAAACFAFVYSAGMIIVSTYRNLQTGRPIQRKSKGYSDDDGDNAPPSPDAD